MAITLLELRTRAQRRADMENSDFIESSEWNQYISDSYLELYDLLVSKFEDYYVADPLEFSLSSGSSTYTLPSDFYKLLGVDRKVTGQDYYTVRPFVFEDRNKQRQADKFRGLYTTARYRIIGGELRFVPADSAAGDYRMWYIPKASELSADTDEMDGVNGWEEYVVIDAAIKALTKEESDISALMAQKNFQLERIERMAQNRDAGETQRVTDITNSGYDDPLYYRW